MGGQLTQTLIDIGDVHCQSAREHLDQARQHSDPLGRHLSQAAGELQNAYLFYDKSLGRGVPLLRRHVALGQLLRAREKAMGCASLEALLQWYLEESAMNRRTWLLRAKQQLISYCIDREESKDPWKSLRIASWLELSGVWSDYYRMSANLLPPDLRDPPPMYFRTIGEVEKVKADIRAIGQDPDVVLGPSSKWPWWEGGFSPSQTL